MENRILVLLCVFAPLREMVLPPREVAGLNAPVVAEEPGSRHTCYSFRGRVRPKQHAVRIADAGDEVRQLRGPPHPLDARTGDRADRGDVAPRPRTHEQARPVVALLRPPADGHRTRFDYD